MNIDLKVIPKNLISDWGNFEDWIDGAASAPTEWTLAGTGAAVARASSPVKYGTYSVKLDRTTNDVTLYHDYSGYADFLGRRMTFGVWIYCSTANAARVQIDDGVNTEESSYHTGGGSWEFIPVTMDIDASATRIRVVLQLNGTGSVSAYYDGAVLVEGNDAQLLLNDEIVISSWKPSRNFDIQKHSRPRFPGSIIPEIKEREITFTVSGSAAKEGGTMEETRAALDEFKRIINRGEKDFFFFDDRFIRGQISSWDETPKPGSNVILFDFKITAEHPYSRHLSAERQEETISSTPTEFTLDQDGDVPVYPVIKISADRGADVSAGFSLQNLTTGEILGFSDDIASGDDLIIDCFNQTIENDGVDALADFSGDFMSLAYGQNTLVYAGDDCTITIDWVKRYYT